MKNLAVPCVVLGGLTALGNLPTRAELPPPAYAKFKADAPEILRLQVLHIKNDPGEAPDSMENRAFTVKAKVLFVRRTKSCLRKGDSISITYERSTPKSSGWAGSAPVPVLNQSTAYRAYSSGGE